jgi:cyclophilin family peptidyl-prolyl cis-trans isomerase
MKVFGMRFIFTILLIGAIMILFSGCGGCGGDKAEEAVPAVEEPAAEEPVISDETAPPQEATPAEIMTEEEETPMEETPTSETETTAAAALADPTLANETAPDSFKVKFATTKGDFIVEATREYSPAGVDRLYNLVKIGFFQETAFFRVLEGFVVQFGIHGDPEVAITWQDATIPDEKTVVSNKPGFLTYAKGGPDTRSTQFFINLVDNGSLDAQGFPPIGKVVQGMDVVASLYSGYGEGAPMGRGPSQAKINTIGNSYLKKEFPNLDYIKTATLVD